MGQWIVGWFVDVHLLLLSSVGAVGPGHTLLLAGLWSLKGICGTALSGFKGLWWFVALESMPRWTLRWLCTGYLAAEGWWVWLWAAFEGNFSHGNLYFWARYWGRSYLPNCPLLRYMTWLEIGAQKVWIWERAGWTVGFICCHWWLGSGQAAFERKLPMDSLWAGFASCLEVKQVLWGWVYGAAGQNFGVLTSELKFVGLLPTMPGSSWSFRLGDGKTMLVLLGFTSSLPIYFLCLNSNRGQ